MMGNNGYWNRRSIRLILSVVDCLLIIIGVFMGGLLRFGEERYLIAFNEYPVWTMLAIVLVIQASFYLFDLYKLIYLREQRRVALSLLKSLSVSFLLLAIVSYSIPSLAIGRGILGLSLTVIYVLAFLWRLVFTALCRTIIKERILIVGTGELSKEIMGDIYENGRDRFEIVGFVEESSGAIYGSTDSGDYRKL